MSTIIYPSPIFGPVRSRRFGISLGINLLPPDGKHCSFDCIYCECGFNADFRPKTKLPTREMVKEALEEKLQQMASENMLPDVLTFAGNGEPTAHPHFPEIIDDVVELRNNYCPQCKITVLSNGTMIHKPEVRAALMKIDNNCQKIDTVDNDYIRHLDRPCSPDYDVNRVVENACLFNGKVTIQTMFLCGEYNGFCADNTADRFVLPWIEAVRKINPEKVMIYTIDRETPAAGLAKAPAQRLDEIAELVRAAGIDCSVSY